jgi:RimJ/RimL family protein N-acetyltransferase
MFRKNHSILLREAEILLRPFQEADWEYLYKWNQDPEVLYFSEGDNVETYTKDQIQRIYKSVCKKAYCFIIQVREKSIGECWIQPMNKKKLLDKYPTLSSFRIDLMIGNKRFWGKGIGTKVIAMLTKFGFEELNADIIFGCDITDYNKRSIKVFQKNEYRIILKETQSPENKAKIVYTVALKKDEYSS